MRVRVPPVPLFAGENMKHEFDGYCGAFVKKHKFLALFFAMKAGECLSSAIATRGEDHELSVFYACHWKEYRNAVIWHFENMESYQNYLQPKR